jgi:predicted dehydrogenase
MGIDLMEAPPLRIGILGTARIARLFVAGVRPSATVIVTAVASRSGDKARQFAREAQIARHHDSYEALLTDPEIDAVYIPLPNSMHAEWSIRAARAGKHVLCEKPLAATASEARAMFDAARQHGVHLVEGYPYRAQPHSLKLQQLLEARAIGRVRLIQAFFGFTVHDAMNIRLDPALAGGSLMDGGTYPVSFVRMVANERPSRVHASARWTERGVDRALAATLKFESGVLAQIFCSFETHMHRHALIAGADGAIQTTFLNFPSVDQPSVIHLRRGPPENTVTENIEVPSLNGFRAEAEAFERLVRAGPAHWPGVSPQESIDIALTLEAILRSARTGKIVELSDGSAEEVTNSGRL